MVARPRRGVMGSSSRTATSEPMTGGTTSAIRARAKANALWGSVQPDILGTSYQNGSYPQTATTGPSSGPSSRDTYQKIKDAPKPRPYSTAIIRARIPLAPSARGGSEKLANPKITVTKAHNPQKVLSHSSGRSIVSL